MRKKEEQQRAMGRSLAVAAARLDAAADTTAVATAEELQRACDIDDDGVHTRIPTSMDQLKSTAARDDAAANVEAGSESDDDEQ